MGVVAPISATAAVVPVVVGIAGGDRPAALQYAGIALALIGVVLASREEVGGAAADRARRRAGAAVGARLRAVLRRAWTVPATTTSRWAMLVNRITSVSVLLAAFAVLRPPLAARRGRPPVLALVGTLDIAANALFAVASTEGLVSLVSVLGSLYPLTTVGLAAVVLGERPHRMAQVGVVAGARAAWC